MISALLLSLALFQAVQQPSPPMGTPKPLTDEKAEKCIIEGKVTSAVDGMPLKKAAVTLLPQAQTGAMLRPVANTTDADGKFLFKDIEPGRYTLNITRNGYARQNYGARVPNGPGTTLAVTAGQHLKDINVRLTPGAAINGRIIDEDNDPVAGVTIRTLRWGFLQGKRQLLPYGFGTTDDRGQFRIYGITPGRYYVSAMYQGTNYSMTMTTATGKEAEETYAPTYYPGVFDASQATAIDLKGGDDIAGIVFRLARVHAVTVSGTVRSATGEPAKSTMLQMFPRATGLIGGAPNMRMSDDKGNFSFSGVMPGSYVVIVRGTIDQMQLSGRADVDVGTAPVENVVIQITNGSEITGTVHLDGAVDLEKSTVRLVLSPEEPMFGVPGGSAELKDNTVTFKAPDGNYNLRAFGLPEDAYISKVVFDEKDSLVEPIRIRGAAAPLDITISANGAHVEGSVLDKDHQPYTGAQVVLVPEESKRSRQDLFRTASSDQYGHFVLRGIPPGSYKLFAWEAIDPGAYMDPDFLKSYENEGKTVQLGPGERSSPEIKVIPSAKTGS